MVHIIHDMTQCYQGHNPLTGNKNAE